MLLAQRAAVVVCELFLSFGSSAGSTREPCVAQFSSLRLSAVNNYDRVIFALGSVLK